MTPTYKRQSIRAAMAHWPRVSSDTRQWLQGLPFRHRRAIILHMGEGRTIEATAAALGCTARTVYRDLSESCGVRELLAMPHDTLEHLVRAILTQAIRDAGRRGVEGYTSRRWLVENDFACALLDLLDIDRDALCARLWPAEDPEPVSELSVSQ